MKVETYYSVCYEANSKDELNALTTVLGPLVPLYDEITVLYQERCESDFCASIEKRSRTVSWTNFDTMKRGEIRFEKLTSDILEEVFNNA